MIDGKFKEVFELSNELHKKNNEGEYNEHFSDNKSIGMDEDYIKQEKQQKIQDAYISKDSYKKENINFDLYLFHFSHTEPIELDDDYKPLPLNNKELYEYGAVISMEDETGYYEISGAFGGIESQEEEAKHKYNTLKNKIEKSLVEELIDELKVDILKQINE